jgi:hypothetical protein
MAKTKKAKVKIKVSGSPEQVQKALTNFAAPAVREPVLREADFRQRIARKKNNAV